MTESDDTAGTGPTLANLIALDIHTGRLSPGTWLKQIDIETRYRAERPAVRTALDALAKRRLVQHVQNRGFRVAEYTPREVAEIFYVRTVLEKTAAELIVKSASDEDIEIAAQRMHDEARKYEIAMAEGLFPEQVAAAKSFHREFLALCPNRELVDLVAEMRDRVSAALLRAWQSREHMSRFTQQHYSMVDALRARDVNLLKSILDEHIMGNVRGGEYNPAG